MLDNNRVFLQNIPIHALKENFFSWTLNKIRRKIISGFPSITNKQPFEGKQYVLQ